MISLLKRIFLKEEESSSSYGRKRYGILCSLVGIVLNLLLFAAKYTIGLLSGSLAILADAKNNLGDASTNIGTLMGMYFAGIHGGKTHPGGHGRIEWLVSLVTSWFVVSLGAHQFLESLQAIQHPVPAQFSLLMLAVLAGSIGVKIYMWSYNRAVGKQIESLSMQAIAADCLTDSVSTAVVCLSMLLEHFANWRTDGWCGLLVAVFIFWSGLQSLKETILTILGRGASQDLQAQIAAIVGQYPSVKGLHGLMVHDYGVGKRFASFYVEGDESSDREQLWNVADRIAQQVYRETNCECTVSTDILVTDPAVVQPVQREAESVLAAFCPEIHLRTCRMLRFSDHINIILEIEAPPSFGRQLEKAVPCLEEKVRALSPLYCPTVRALSMPTEHYHQNRLKKLLFGKKSSVETEPGQPVQK